MRCSLARAAKPSSTERSDRVWILNGELGRATAARLVDPAGSTLTAPVSLPADSNVIMATTRYLVLDSGVRRYRVDHDGNVTPLDGVVPLAPLDPDRALAAVCDDAAHCGVGVVDLDTGSSSRAW